MCCIHCCTQKPLPIIMNHVIRRFGNPYFRFPDNISYLESIHVYPILWSISLHRSWWTHEHSNVFFLLCANHCHTILINFYVKILLNNVNQFSIRNIP